MCFFEVSGLALGQDLCLSEPSLFEKILIKHNILNQ